MNFIIKYWKFFFNIFYTHSTTPIISLIKFLIADNLDLETLDKISSLRLGCLKLIHANILHHRRKFQAQVYHRILYFHLKVKLYLVGTHLFSVLFDQQKFYLDKYL